MRTTKQGITASLVVGLVSSLTWMLLSQDAITKVYKMTTTVSPMPFAQPGLVTIPLAFLTLIVVSLMTSGTAERVKSEQLAAAGTK